MSWRLSQTLMGGLSMLFSGQWESQSNHPGPENWKPSWSSGLQQILCDPGWLGSARTLAPAPTARDTPRNALESSVCRTIWGDTLG
eukprot:854904-Amphidinium_carterae.1